MIGPAQLKRGLKVAVAHALYYTGILQLWQALALRRKAVVLMYHRVLTPQQQEATGSHPAIIVDRATFAAHMAILRQRFVVLSVEEFADRIARRVPFESSSCLITFDDGWEDNATNALEPLVEHNLPAIIFLPVHFIGARRLFWREALTHLLVEAAAVTRTAEARRAAFETLLRPMGLSDVLTLSGPAVRSSIVSAVHRESGRPLRDLERLVTELSRELGVRVDELPTPDTFMSWSQVRTLSQRGVAFGGHGANHCPLDSLPLEGAEAEIAIARSELDAQIPQAVRTFSYPNGNWTPAVADAVRTAGYQLAFTTAAGTVTAEDDPFTLRRMNISEATTSSVPLFLARLVGLF